MLEYVSIAIASSKPLTPPFRFALNTLFRSTPLQCLSLISFIYLYHSLHSIAHRVCRQRKGYILDTYRRLVPIAYELINLISFHIHSQ